MGPCLLRSDTFSLLCFSVQKLDECDILLGPEVTYGPPGLDLLGPVAMSIAHCAEVDMENWNIQLKRRTQDSKWEVRHAHSHTDTHTLSHSHYCLTCDQSMALLKIRF